MCHKLSDYERDIIKPLLPEREPWLASVPVSNICGTNCQLSNFMQSRVSDPQRKYQREASHQMTGLHL